MASNVSRASGIALLVLLATVHVAASQTFLGGIRGAVRDASGVLPGGEVTLTNEATGATWTTTTNDAGEYTFPNVLPGTYSLAASLAAYRKFESRGLVIGTQQFMVVDVVLAVGPIVEQVIVTGATPLVDRASASVASLIDKATLDTLPSSGRNPFSFLDDDPECHPCWRSAISPVCRIRTRRRFLAIAGGPPRANTYLLDGAPITDLLNRAVIIPSAEALEEVSVQVHTYDASFGRTGGGVFNSTHRSGSNIWHGSALVRSRPDWGSSNRFFAEQAGDPEAGELQLRVGWLCRRAYSPPIAPFSGQPPRAIARARRRQRAHVAHGVGAPRRLLAECRRRRTPDRHLRPADDAAEPEKP